jgi:hypothetical protein
MQEKGRSRDTMMAINSDPTTMKSSRKKKTENTVIRVLKEEYFRKIKMEDYPNTPKITDELDALEEIIDRELSENNQNEPPSK